MDKLIVVDLNDMEEVKELFLENEDYCYIEDNTKGKRLYEFRKDLEMAIAVADYNKRLEEIFEKENIPYEIVG